MSTLTAQALEVGWLPEEVSPGVDVALVHVDRNFLVFARPDQHTRAPATYSNLKNRFGALTHQGDATFRAGAVLVCRRETVEAIRAGNEWLSAHGAGLRGNTSPYGST